MRSKLIYIVSALWLLSITAGAQDYHEVFKAVTPDRAGGDEFGFSVSISGNYAIVGAIYEDEDAEGVNTLYWAGSAYIFERDGSGNWNEVQKIVASDREYDGHFGYSVSISGNYAIISAPSETHDAEGEDSLYYAGSAYIFERDGSGNWNEVQKIVASDRAEWDLFGYSVSISGNYAIIAAPSKDQNAEGEDSLAGSGSAYIFERNGSGNWNEVQKIGASDRDEHDDFGFSVSISDNYVLIGAHCENHDVDGMDSIYGAGSAYIFERDGSGNWEEVQKIVASDRAEADYFGNSVGISDNYAIISALDEAHDAEGEDSLYHAGSAYMFERDGSGSWNEVQKIVASDRARGDWFGYSVSISGDYAIVGAYYEDEDPEGGNTHNAAGSAYIFKRDGSGNWEEVQKIVASDRSMGDLFGNSVSISGNYVFVGAYKEDHDAEGGHTLVSSGSAYIFESDMPIGIPDVNQDNGTGVKIFPNPVSDYVNIYTEEGSTVELYNGMGLPVMEENTLNGQLRIETSGLPKGMYMVKVNTGNRVTVTKVVIQ